MPGFFMRRFFASLFPIYRQPIEPFIKPYIKPYIKPLRRLFLCAADRLLIVSFVRSCVAGPLTLKRG